MAASEGPIHVRAAPQGGEGGAAPADAAALMTADTDQLATSSHDQSSPSSSPEVGFREDPPVTPERGGGEEGVFSSAVYRGLGERWATPEEKMATGYRLIDAQRKDVDRMTSRLTDIQSQLREKDNSVAQLYTMIEKVSPVLKQMSGWNAKLTAEEEQLQEELRKVKKALGIEEADTGDSTSLDKEAPGATASVAQ